jgi:hypothetical protein
MPASNQYRRSGAQKVIDDLTAQMLTTDPTDPAYAKMAEQLIRLYPLIEQDSKKRLSQDTLAIVLGNLVGIGMIVWYERAHVVTSKALGFVLRMR